MANGGPHNKYVEWEATGESSEHRTTWKRLDGSGIFSEMLRSNTVLALFLIIDRLNHLPLLQILRDI